MKTALIIGALGLITAGTLGGIALARDGGAAMRPSFAELDANGDGKLTQAELTAHHSAHLAQIDSDGDGILSTDELAQMMHGRAVRRADRMVARLDQDNDGKLSIEEMQDHAQNAGPGRMFDHMDSDSDGAISAEEYAQLSSHHRDHKGKGGYGKTGHGKDGDRAHHGWGPKSGHGFGHGFWGGAEDDDAEDDS